MVRRYRRRVPRRRALRKGYRGKKMIRYAGMSSGVKRFKEMCQITDVSAVAASTGTGVMKFKLNDLTNAPNFKQLFDLYKLTGVKVKLVPQYNSADVGPNASGAIDYLPQLFIAPNRDPYVPAPTSVADILNDDSCKVIRGGRIISLYLSNPKPELKANSQDGLTQFFMPIQFNSSSRALQPWLATGGNGQVQDQSGIDHFGFRWFVDNTQSAVACWWRVYATYYFSMKEQD